VLLLLRCGSSLPIVQVSSHLWTLHEQVQDLVHGWEGCWARAGWCWGSASNWVWVRGFAWHTDCVYRLLGHKCATCTWMLLDGGCMQARVQSLSMHRKLAETALLLWAHVVVLLCCCTYTAAVRVECLVLCASQLLPHLRCVMGVLLGGLQQCWHQQLCSITA
jgi:hypothetical protein